MCKDPGVFYIDTDLPDIIKRKKKIVQELAKRFCNYPADNLFLLALNVLDNNAFIEIINLFPTGPFAIANEGLLVYLDKKQKRRLCAIIHSLLSEKGGYWITADIYIKKGTEDAITNDFYDEKGKKFILKHQLEENKFESFKTAEIFFKECGFDIYKKIEISSNQLSLIKFLTKIPKHELEDMKGRKKLRETWILKTNGS
jgi:O-methyltransferase involved in polyketide biosynthesis